MRRGLLFQLTTLAVATLALAATLEELRAIEDQWSMQIVTTGRKTGKPRPTTIWFVHEDGVVWVQSGKGGSTSWYRNLLKTPDVTLRFDGLTTAGRAVPIDDAGETERVHQLFLDKYWTARISTWFGGGFGTGKVVRIEALTTAPDEAVSSRGGAGAHATSPRARRPE